MYRKRETFHEIEKERERNRDREREQETFHEKINSFPNIKAKMVLTRQNGNY